MIKPIIVIKTGGRAAEDEKALGFMALEIKKLSEKFDFIFVHGGGSTVSSIQRVYGIEPVFKDGIRITSEKEMDLVDMGLAGKMNKKLVRLFIKNGVSAAGICGADGPTLIGESIADKSCRTGKIINPETIILYSLLNGGFIPILSSVSIDSEGGALNINADEAALAAGTACKAEKIVFISDIPGILNGDEQYTDLNESEINQLIDSKIINGGMIPKVKSSLEALKNGAGTVVIGDYQELMDLEKLLSGAKGTKIWLK
jgi:acetylglutamate kinase